MIKEPLCHERVRPFFMPKEEKFAILLDGAFVTKKLGAQLGHFPSAEEVESFCQQIEGNQELSNLTLLRRYFYHADPFDGVLTNPISGNQLDCGSTQIFRDNRSLLDRLELKPFFALRLGEIKAHEWKLGNRAARSISRHGARQLTERDLVPGIEQKGVDLRIGLDIARLALTHIVEIVVVVTGDSDLIPAFKFARREGIRVYLHHMQHGVQRELKAHCDLVF